MADLTIYPIFMNLNHSFMTAQAMVLTTVWSLLFIDLAASGFELNLLQSSVVVHSRSAPQMRFLILATQKANSLLPVLADLT